MKASLLILSMTLSVSVFGQKITTELMRIQSVEKNPKTIIFSKQIVASQNNFLIKARNESSSEYINCKWVVKLSANKMEQLHQTLSQVNFEKNNNITCKKISIKVKQDRVKVIFFDSSCIKDHKLGYFQKSCNKELGFILFPEQINSFVQAFEGVLNNLIVEK